MDSQMNSKLLNQIFENDIIFFSAGECDMNLLEIDLDVELEKDFNTTKKYSIINELMDGPPTHHTKHQHSPNTITSTIFSTISHPLSTMTTTTTRSIINTISLTATPTTSHDDTQHNTTPVDT